MCFFSLHVGCIRRRMVCYSLHVGCCSHCVDCNSRRETTLLAVAGAMRSVTSSTWDVQVMYGLLQELCVLFHLLLGLL